MKKVTVIGAGFSGLTLSWYLAKRGVPVEILEASPRIGGLISTKNLPWGLSETAANAIISTDLSERLFADLKLAPSRPLKIARKRFIFRGQPRRWPLTLTESWAFAWRFLPRFLLNRLSLKPTAQESLQEWGNQHLSPAATQYILGPAMQGIYAADISELNADLILGSLFNPKPPRETRYQGMLSGAQGMQDLIDALYKSLLSMGVPIHLDTQVDISKIAGPVVISTSAKSAEQLTQNKFPEISELLSQIQMGSVFNATVFFEKSSSPWRGFGCLIPQIFQFQTLGILMNSFIFENRQKTPNENWLVKMDENLPVDSRDEEILKVIKNERSVILNASDEIAGYAIHRWCQALPVYNNNLAMLQPKLRDLQSPETILLHGNYLEGIGLSKILERSHRLAQEIHKYVE